MAAQELREAWAAHKEKAHMGLPGIVEVWYCLNRYIDTTQTSNSPFANTQP